jgi:Holliday junction DNA helicase RuvA
MFYHIEGIVSEIGTNYIVLDCGGLGFQIYSSLSSIAGVTTGKKAKLLISEAISENTFDLYGFISRKEKQFFDLLLSISGVGPKAAISLLSYVTPDQLAASVINNDVKALTAAPGIGKKIAQRIVLELKDKIAAEVDSVLPSYLPIQTNAPGNKTMSDAVAALTVLGYSSSEINPVLKTIDASDMTTEQIIKAVLKALG